MTKEETMKIMSMLGAFYSGSKNNPKLQAEAWHLILQKYDYKTAQAAVLHFAENDRRDYATFPAVGVIVNEINLQKQREARPVREIIRRISYGQGYEELSDDAKRLISPGIYDKWLHIDAEEFASKADSFAELLSTGHTLMIE